MERRWLLEKDGDVRKRHLSQTRGIVEDFGGQTRAELPAALPALHDVNSEVFGEPMGIHEVATLIGCSAWTVRQRHLVAGLPHFRSGPNGRLIFYRNQVIHWLLKQQQKGGSST
jgi:hypothetical protein